MLTTNQILKTKPVFILSVNYDAGSLADMTGEYDRDDNSHHVWGHDTDEDLHETLLELMESQPINDIPESFVIESY